MIWCSRGAKYLTSGQSWTFRDRLFCIVRASEMQSCMVYRNTISHAGLVGGGKNPRPGEISLTHHGVLFLDELPEFDERSLEAMRQPLEDHIVTISRASGTLTFPANFQLIAAMNPCPQG